MPPDAPRPGDATLPDHLVPAPAPDADAAEPAHPRYAFAETLGLGATARVLAARDRTFGREVAVKALYSLGGGSAARFLREARVTAMLDHPNVVTVHDLEFTAAGGAYLVMRRIRGVSLGELLGADGLDGRRTAVLGGSNAVITILLKVCDALARAHAMGVVHRDVKPDNILVGEHGEVVLADWGEAIVAGEDHESRMAVGTPAYMAPEQARGERADARSDVYALGATLFHALVGRPPMEAGNVRAAVDRRARGEFLSPTPAEQRRLPAGLWAVIRQAMAADPAKRYQAVADLRADLVRFQEGLSVAALREPAPVRAMRWLWRHRRAVAAAVVLAATIGGLAGLLWWERSRGIARWGDPLVVEAFADDGWSTRWRERNPGTWRRDGGRIVSSGAAAAMLVWPHRLHVPLAIEYDGEILPGAAPCDVSCVWWEGGDIARFPDDPDPSTWIQLGAWVDSCSVILRGPGSGVAAFSPRRLVPGRRHHVRVEFEDDAVRAFVDGELWLEHRDLFPVRSGYIGLYGYFPGKAFSDVRIWSKGMPERVGVLAVGDALYRRGRLVDAAEEWDHVAESHPGTPLAADARLRSGLARQRAGDRVGADAAWDGLGGEAGDTAAVLRLEGVWAAGDRQAFTTGFADAWKRLPAQRTRLSALWSACVGPRKWSNPMGAEAEQRVLMELRRRVMGDDALTALDAAELLIREGTAAEAEAGIRSNQRAWSDAMLALGRNRALWGPDSPAPWYVPHAGFSLGLLAEVSSDPACFPDLRTLCHAKLGDAAAARVQGDPNLAEVLVGDPARVLTSPTRRNESINAALLQLGQLERAATRGPPGSEGGASRCAQILLRWEDRPDDQLEMSRQQASQARWLRALEDGRQPDAAQRTAAAADPFDQRTQGEWFIPWFAVPFVEGRLAGEAGRAAMAQRAAASEGILCQRPLWLARLLAGQAGREEVLRQPARSEGEAWWLLGSGMRAELDGDRAAALAAYRAFRALPMQRRLLIRWEPDPMVERFVAWRCAALEAR